MNTLVPLKISASDWPRTGLVAALHGRACPLRQLALRHGGKSTGALDNTLDRPRATGERLNAAAIGADPETICASRYLKRKFTPVLALPLAFDRSDTNDRHHGARA
ncbi:helix-turn-helix domain-containing protein [Neisseriaceae bacterium JH1-16]|nr:helix-turn-helix domain-containing protein [Neisseriaceae bacterium JH1-16]